MTSLPPQSIPSAKYHSFHSSTDSTIIAGDNLLEAMILTTKEHWRLRWIMRGNSTNMIEYY